MTNKEACDVLIKLAGYWGTQPTAKLMSDCQVLHKMPTAQFLWALIECSQAGLIRNDIHIDTPMVSLSPSGVSEYNSLR